MMQPRMNLSRLKAVIRMLNKFLILLQILIFSAASLTAVDIPDGKSPEEIEKLLLSDIASLTEKEQKDRYITLAELYRISGDLENASEYFKKASLTVKGGKDFEALYKSAVLNVEMAFYREAEAQLRALSTFCDDINLRIKAAVLTARIKALLDFKDAAYSLLLDVIKSGNELPAEAVHYALDFYNQNSATMNLEELETFLSGLSPSDKTYTEVKKIITPEYLLGKLPPAASLITSTETEAETGSTFDETADNGDEKKQIIFIQLGSFSVKENAEDLLKTVKNKGWDRAVIKEKTVNGKKYFAVAIPADEEENVQNLVITLKEDGLEGYPVY